MTIWEDTVNRRKEKDPLMAGGKNRSVNEVKVHDIRCAKAKCQSRNVKLEFNYGICLDCHHAWKRRK